MSRLTQVGRKVVKESVMVGRHKNYSGLLAAVVSSSGSTQDHTRSHKITQKAVRLRKHPSSQVMWSHTHVNVRHNINYHNISRSVALAN
jgi:hypothetical protein